MKIGEAVYKAQAETASQAAPEPGSAGAAPDDKVVDAEFEEVDEKKKKSA
jgi:molecular chaperone DnaK